MLAMVSAVVVLRGETDEQVKTLPTCSSSTVTWQFLSVTFDLHTDFKCPFFYTYDKCKTCMANFPAYACYGSPSTSSNHSGQEKRRGFFLYFDVILFTDALVVPVSN